MHVVMVMHQCILKKKKQFLCTVYLVDFLGKVGEVRPCGCVLACCVGEVYKHSQIHTVVLQFAACWYRLC